MAKKYPLVILHYFIPVHTHQYFLLNSGGSWWCLRWGLTRSLYMPAVTYLLNAVASGGGTRPKAMCRGILAASMSSWPSRTCQSDPGVSSTIKSAGTMQIVPFCQHSVTKAKKYAGFFPFFRSETEGSGTLLHSPIFFLLWQRFSMEVLKSATTPNCATWTLFSGMTSLTQARSLSQCLNLQATCHLVSINLPKVLCTPPFQREWTSCLSCGGFQVHQFLPAGPPSPVLRENLSFLHHWPKM